MEPIRATAPGLIHPLRAGARCLATTWRVVARTAWVPTLVLAVVAFLLFGVEQSQDILSGLQQNIVLAAQGAFPPGFRGFGWRAYAGMWLSAAALSLMLALVSQACLHVLPRAQRAAPDVAQLADGLRRWRSVYPRGVLFATLFVVHSAFLRAQMPEITDIREVLLVVSMQLLATLLVFLSPALVAVRWPRLGRGMRVMVVVGAACLIWHEYTRPGMLPPEARLATAISALTPGLALWLPVPARLWPARSLMAMGAMAVVLVVMGCVPWTAATLLWTGSITVVLLFATLAAALLAALVLLARLFLRVDPVLVAGIVVAVVLLHGERLGEEGIPVRAEPQARAGVEGVQTAATGTHGYAIHADGGGLRAALYTAMVLAMSDDLTCGEFGRHVYAASGVSGGSLGIATWAVLRQEYVRREGPDAAWAPCRAALAAARLSGRKAEIPGFPLALQVAHTLAQDHLSAALETMLTRDLVGLGPAMRGQALLESWQQAAVQAMGGNGSEQAFGRKLSGLDAGVAPAPLLMFTATDVATGQRIVFRNRPAAGCPGHGAQLPAPDQAGQAFVFPAPCGTQAIQVGVAALHSARFPLISPTGKVADTPGTAHPAHAAATPEDASYRLAVDGGYFDNSGAASLRAALDDAAVGDVPDLLEIVRINGNVPEQSSGCAGVLPRMRPWPFDGVEGDAGTAGPVSAHWTGLRTFWQVRQAHAEAAVRLLDASGVQGTPGPAGQGQANRKIRLNTSLQLDYDAVGQVQCDPGTNATDCLRLRGLLCADASMARRAPLGWSLSYGTGDAMQFPALLAAGQLVRGLNEDGVAAHVSLPAFPQVVVTSP